MGWGWRPSSLGSAYSRQAPLQRLARPILTRSWTRPDTTRTSPCSTVDDVLYLVEERAPRRPSLVSDVGVRLPAQPPRAGWPCSLHCRRLRSARSTRRGPRSCSGTGRGRRLRPSCAPAHGGSREGVCGRARDGHTGPRVGGGGGGGPRGLPDRGVRRHLRGTTCRAAGGGSPRRGGRRRRNRVVAADRHQDEGVTTTSLLADLERYYDTAPRARCDTEEHGPLTLFVARSGFPYYARPRLGLTDEVTTPDVTAVLERQRELDVPQAVEWVHDTTPSLLPAAREAGMTVEECPLLVLEQDPPELDPAAGVRIVAADDPALSLVRAAINVGFGTAGTSIGTASVAERDADALARPEGAERVAALISAGLSVLAGAFDPEAGPVGGGSRNPRGAVTEVVGVGVLPGLPPTRPGGGDHRGWPGTPSTTVFGRSSARRRTTPWPGSTSRSGSGASGPPASPRSADACRSTLPRRPPSSCAAVARGGWERTRPRPPWVRRQCSTTSSTPYPPPGRWSPSVPRGQPTEACAGPGSRPPAGARSPRSPLGCRYSTRSWWSSSPATCRSRPTPRPTWPPRCRTTRRPTRWSPSIPANVEPAARRIPDRSPARRPPQPAEGCPPPVHCSSLPTRRCPCPPPTPRRRHPGGPGGGPP